MDAGQSSALPRQDHLARLARLDYGGSRSVRSQHDRSVIRKALAAANGWGFSYLCPRCVLDVEPQSFFDDGCSSRHSPVLLELVYLLEQVGWQIRGQRNTASRELARPMGGNILANLFRVTLHA